jgi:hypothetical protein
MFRYVNNEKGSALILTLIIMVVLVIIGATLATVSMAEVRQGIRHEKLSQAHYVSITAAEAVADYLISNQTSSEVKNMIAFLEAGGTVTFPNVDFPNDSFGNGTYQVAVTGQPGSLTIQSTGVVQNDFEKSNTLVISNVYPDPFWGEYAVAAKTFIEAAGGSFGITGSIMSGGSQKLTDSQLNNVSGDTIFNSTSGFPMVKPTFDEFIAEYGYAPSNTVVVSNGITGNYTFNHGNIYEIGTASHGYAINIGGGDVLTFNTGSDGDITMLNLEGSLRQGGNSGMTFVGHGTVIFYVDGDIDLSGGSWNQVGFSGNVLFYVPKGETGSRSVLFSGNTSYQAHIIAPDAQMIYNGGGSNTFTGMAVVEYFKGHGSFSILQEPESSDDLNALLV